MNKKLSRKFTAAFPCSVAVCPLEVLVLEVLVHVKWEGTISRGPALAVSAGNGPSSSIKSSRTVRPHYLGSFEVVRGESSVQTNAKCGFHMQSKASTYSQ